MKAKGEIQIDEIEVGTVITNPTLEIKGYYVECVFTDEAGLKNNRMIKLGSKDIDNEIKKHKLLSQFK